MHRRNRRVRGPFFLRRRTWPEPVRAGGPDFGFGWARLAPFPEPPSSRREPVPGSVREVFLAGGGWNGR